LDYFFFPQSLNNLHSFPISLLTGASTTLVPTEIVALPFTYPGKLFPSEPSIQVLFPPPSAASFSFKFHLPIFSPSGRSSRETDLPPLFIFFSISFFYVNPTLFPLLWGMLFGPEYFSFFPILSSPRRILSPPSGGNVLTQLVCSCPVPPKALLAPFLNFTFHEGTLPAWLGLPIPI